MLSLPTEMKQMTMLRNVLSYSPQGRHAAGQQLRPLLGWRLGVCGIALVLLFIHVLLVLGGTQLSCSSCCLQPGGCHNIHLLRCLHQQQGGNCRSYKRRRWHAGAPAGGICTARNVSAIRDNRSR
jgi:hypothetical protein